ncbi:MAG: hypothetical protein IJH39_10080 [Clostridia bacterium]|nr:hypothetical protein [Clostridia bacterium]
MKVKKQKSKKQKSSMKSISLIVVAVVLLVTIIGHFINAVNADTEDMFSGGTSITSGTTTFTRENENNVLSDDCTAYFTNSQLTSVTGNSDGNTVTDGINKITVNSGSSKSGIVAKFDKGINIGNTNYDLYMQITKVEYTMTNGSSDSAKLIITSGEGGPQLKVEGMKNNNSIQGILRADCKFYAKDSGENKVPFKGLIRVQNIGARKGARILNSSLGKIFIEDGCSTEFKNRIQYIKGTNDYFIFDPLTHEQMSSHNNNGKFSSADKANVYVEMKNKVTDLSTQFYFRQDSALRIGPAKMVNLNKGFKSNVTGSAKEDYSGVTTENMGKWSTTGGNLLNSLGTNITSEPYYIPYESRDSWITSKTPTGVELYNYKGTTVKTPTNERWTVGFSSTDNKDNAQRIKEKSYSNSKNKMTINGNDNSNYNAFISNPNTNNAGIYVRKVDGKYYYYYSFPLTSNSSIADVATIKYTNAAKVNGKDVDIYMDVNNLKVTKNPYKNGTGYSSDNARFDQVIFFNCLIGYSDSATYNANNITYVRPSFGIACYNHSYSDGVERARWIGVPSFADVSYRFAPAGTQNFIDVKGCLSLTDIDHGQSIQIRDFKIDRDNVFYVSGDNLSTDHVKYKIFDDGSGTYFYDKCSVESNTDCNSKVYVLAGTQSSDNGVPILRNCSSIPRKICI